MIEFCLSRQIIGIHRLAFFQAERQPDRDKAIIDSHVACLRYATEQSVPYVLVFEDVLEIYKGCVITLTSSY